MSENLDGKVALITGAARRVGAAIARELHTHGMNLILHYRSSKEEAHCLQEELLARRDNSVTLIQSDLLNTAKLKAMIYNAVDSWGRLDVLVNNASSFYATPIGSATEQDWDNLIGSNMKAPFFLSQAAAPLLLSSRGCIINITDIHADRPLKNFSLYSAAKAGLVMITKSLARELGPQVRVNAVAPGAIMWPENELDDVTKKRIISNTALKRRGDTEDIARAVLFLIQDAGYITGQTIIVDGGRTLHE